MKLFLVAYTHEVDAINHSREITSISFGEDFEKETSVIGIVSKVEKQTSHRSVQLIAITALHNHIVYAGEPKREASENSTGVMA